MRFVLDECVDARLAGIFRGAGHDCWTIADAGLSGENDDEVSVYAQDHDAVLVTDDRELLRRRRADLFGRYLDLRGPKRTAGDSLSVHLVACTDRLVVSEAVIVAVSVEGAWIAAPAHLRERRPRGY